MFFKANLSGTAVFKMAGLERSATRISMDLTVFNGFCVKRVFKVRFAFECESQRTGPFLATTKSAVQHGLQSFCFSPNSGPSTNQTNGNNG